MTTPGGRRKRGPANRSPPGDPKKTKEDDEVCLICDVTIQDSDDEPNEALYCEGDCQGWLHRKCVGMTKKLYLTLGQSEEPYICPHCKLNAYQEEINNLKGTIKSLTDELTHLKSKEESTYSAVAAASDEQDPATSHSVDQPLSSSKVTKPDTKPPAGILPGDRKFNIVMFGITENPPDTRRPDRIKYDMTNCLNIITKLNPEINSQSIRDCLRLGKYKQSTSRPRPVLLKLNRSLDVTGVLSNRDQAPNGVVIKPDLTPQERQRNSLLLGERWKLMQAGTDKRNIKIKASTIYLNGNKYAQVLNNCLQYYDSNRQTMQRPSESVPSQHVSDMDADSS